MCQPPHRRRCADGKYVHERMSHITFPRECKSHHQGMALPTRDNGRSRTPWHRRPVGTQQRAFIHVRGRETRGGPWEDRLVVCHTARDSCVGSSTGLWNGPTGAENLGPQKTSTATFLAAFLGTANTRTQPRCPSEGDRGQNVVRPGNKIRLHFPETGYQAMKINTRGRLKCIERSERFQSEMATESVIALDELCKGNARRQ